MADIVEALKIIIKLQISYKIIAIQAYVPKETPSLLDGTLSSKHQSQTASQTPHRVWG
jgi:hypothetical protein